MAGSSHVSDVIDEYGRLKISEDDQEGLILDELSLEKQSNGYDRKFLDKQKCEFWSYAGDFINDMEASKGSFYGGDNLP